MNALENKRPNQGPKGLFLIVTMSVISAILSVYAGSQMIQQISSPYTNSSQLTAESLLLLALLGIMLIFLSIFWIVSAFGLLTITEWGWLVSVWSYLASIPVYILASIALQPFQYELFGDSRLQGVLVIMAILVHFYLISRPVKKHYIKIKPSIF